MLLCDLSVSSWQKLIIPCLRLYLGKSWVSGHLLKTIRNWFCSSLFQTASKSLFNILNKPEVWDTYETWKSSPVFWQLWKLYRAEGYVYIQRRLKRRPFWLSLGPVLGKKGKIESHIFLSIEAVSQRKWDFLTEYIITGSRYSRNYSPAILTSKLTEKKNSVTRNHCKSLTNKE